MGGGHSFGGGGGFGGGSHAFSGGGSHSFGGPSISHGFSGGGNSRGFAPQSFSRGSSNWAHGQSNWQHGLGSSNWQSARNTSAWHDHINDWNHGQQWSHNNNHWWGNSNWAGNNNWGHNGNWWGHGNWWGRNWWWGNNGFSYYPVFTFGFPWWYDNYYPSYDYYPSYGYVSPYYDSASYAYDAAPYAATTAYGATTALASQPDVVQTQYPEDPQPTQPSVGSDAGSEYFAEATTAFHSGQYREALRLANHAAVESPQNAKAHELMSLAMFALADYRGASAEAHAALAFAPPAAWATVYNYYGDDATYTNQLRALEKYSRENPTAADARFVRAYEYLMLGHEPQALDQLRDVTKLEPHDRLATELLKKYGEPASDQQTPPGPAPLPANPGGGARSLDGGVDS